MRQLQASEQALSAQLAQLRQHEGQLEQEVTKLTGETVWHTIIIIIIITRMPVFPVCQCCFKS